MVQVLLRVFFTWTWLLLLLLLGVRVVLRRAAAAAAGLLLLLPPVELGGAGHQKVAVRVVDYIRKTHTSLCGNSNFRQKNCSVCFYPAGKRKIELCAVVGRGSA